MSVFVEMALAAAGPMAAALTRDGYTADFTVGALAEIDRYLNDHMPGGEPTPGGPVTPDESQQLFGLTSYIGETVRQEFAGAWRQRPGARTDPRGMEVVLADGRVIQPAAWLMYRLGSPPGGLARLGWLLLDHSYLVPADGRAWLSPAEAVGRLRAALADVREQAAEAVNAANPLLAHLRASGVTPDEVLAEVEAQVGQVRYVSVGDAAGGRRVELDIAPEDRIAVHHTPALRPLVGAIAAALGYTVDRPDPPPVEFPTTVSPPEPRGVRAWLLWLIGYCD